MINVSAVNKEEEIFVSKKRGQNSFRHLLGGFRMPESKMIANHYCLPV